MKVAVIGSRGRTIDNLGDYLPETTTEIISGGSEGIDTCAREYAVAHNIKFKEYLPDYEKYDKTALLMRSVSIIETADMVLAFWDGRSSVTKFVIDMCRDIGVPIKVYKLGK